MLERNMDWRICELAAIKRGAGHQLVDRDRKLILKRADSGIARQLQAIALHELDLRFCRYCLTQLASVDKEQQSDLAEAFWISCIARFYKCFGNSRARTKLSEKKIFKGKPEAQLAYKFFSALRDKHIIHDENPYSQAVVAVAINPSEAPDLLKGVGAMTIPLYIINENNVKRLSELIDSTYAWVLERQAELVKLLTETYSQRTRDQLLALPDLTVNKPEDDDVYLSR